MKAVVINVNLEQYNSYHDPRSGKFTSPTGSGVVRLGDARAVATAKAMAGTEKWKKRFAEAEEAERENYPTKKIPAFHGTNADFDKFDERMIGKSTDEGFLGRGFYFSTDPQVGRSSKVTMSVDLAVKNPLELKMPSWEADKKALVREALGLPENASATEVTNTARAKGFDGVTLDYSPLRYHQKEIVVFSPEQIKVTGKGTVKSPK